MKTLRLALPLVMGLGWLVGAGCEDDRGVVDLGAGGDVAQPGGAGGAAAGAGGAGCPTNIFEADGKACGIEGMICGDGADDPCQFGQSVICVSGTWQHQEAFPGPCGGFGGQLSGGGAGAGGGGAGEGGGAAGGGGGGGAAGEGGHAAEEYNCPANPVEADGKPCAAEGLFCWDYNAPVCESSPFSVCTHRKWEHHEAPPSPCSFGGAGGGGAGGAP